jgi:rod shape-determining protein MreC
MQKILLFLFRIKTFLLFVGLEVIAFSFITSQNSQQGSVFFNSSNQLSGSFLETKSNVLDYFSLGDVNKSLVQKNAELLAELQEYKSPPDSAFIEVDSALFHSFEFKAAKVINNSLRLSQNYITINKGSKHGIKEGMGVFNEEGVVGRVKGVSENFATIFSLLHTEILISSKIEGTDVFGSTKWDGKNPRIVQLLYIPRHVQVKVGEKIVTSGYNAVFPEGIAIGKIIDVKSGTDANYLEVTLQLATDFSKISYVYLVQNNMEQELDELYQSSGINNE